MHHLINYLPLSVTVQRVTASRLWNLMIAY